MKMARKTSNCHRTIVASLLIGFLTGKFRIHKIYSCVDWRNIKKSKYKVLSLCTEMTIDDFINLLCNIRLSKRMDQTYNFDNKDLLATFLVIKR